jgi:hypothetical protein
MTSTLRTRIISVLALSCSLLGFLPAAHSQQGFTFNIGPSKGEVVGASVGAAAVITAAIVIPVVLIHKHHNLKGCILTADTGLQLRQADAKTFTLTGLTADVKPGNRVSLHGTKQKPTKANPNDLTFTVDHLTKDYGPCKLPAPTTSLASTP